MNDHAQERFDVFLSYNSKDQPTVLQLAEALKQRGLRVWLDEWELVPGRPFQEALAAIIQTTLSAAVLVGEDGLGPWEIPEMRSCLNQFVRRRLPVIPVLLPSARKQPDLPLFLQEFIWVDLRADGLSDTNLDRLEWGITGKKPSSEPSPSLPAVPPPPTLFKRRIVQLTVIFSLLTVLTVLTVLIKPSLVSAPDPRVFQDTLQDGTPGPEMVRIPADTFMMGSPTSEIDRDQDEKQHQLQIEQDFAIGKYEVTVGQFKKFVEATGYKTEAEKEGGCYYWIDRIWEKDPAKNWRNPGFPQDKNQPVVCISWNDAMAYAKWLTKQTGRQYRLPTEAEWEYAARAGTTTAYYWGDNPNEGCHYANGADQMAKAQFSNMTIMNCQDGFVYTAPVGGFQPNAFDLYDILGNVWEWTCSEYDENYYGGEKICVDSNPSSQIRVFRGGAWDYDPHYLRAAYRSKFQPDIRQNSIGFRLYASSIKQ